MLQNFYKKTQLSEYITWLLYCIAFLLPFAVEITTVLIYIAAGLALYERIKRKKIFASLCKHNYLLRMQLEGKMEKLKRVTSEKYGFRIFHICQPKKAYKILFHLTKILSFCSCQNKKISKN